MSSQTRGAKRREQERNETANMFGIKKKKKNKDGKKVPKKPKAMCRAECQVRQEEKFLHKLPRTCFKVYAPNNKSHLKLIFVVKPEEGRWKNTQFFIEAIYPSTAPQDYPMHPPECKLYEGFKVYHPNIDLEGHICDGLRKAWKPQYDITFCAYAWLNLFVDPNPLDPLNHKASLMMRDNVKGFDSLVRRSLAGETLKIDVQRDGSDVKETHEFPSTRDMNAIRPDPSWTQLFPK